MNSSSVYPMPSSPPALTHSLNSRGELGMFVNPYTCPCQVCKDYLSTSSTAEESAAATAGTGEEPSSNAVVVVAATEQPRDRLLELNRLEDLYEDRWREAGGGTLRSPSTGATSTTWYLGAMLDEINERRLALGLDKYGGPPSMGTGCSAWGCTDKNCQSPEATPALTSPPASARRFVSRAVPTLPPPPPLVRVNAFTDCLGRVTLSLEELEETTMDSLRTLRSRLQTHRATRPCDIDSEEAVAAADAESAEIQAKITAIEGVLHAFGVTFRNP